MQFYSSEFLGEQPLWPIRFSSLDKFHVYQSSTANFQIYLKLSSRLPDAEYVSLVKEQKAIRRAR